MLNYKNFIDYINNEEIQDDPLFYNPLPFPRPAKFGKKKKKINNITSYLTQELFISDNLFYERNG